LVKIGMPGEIHLLSPLISEEWKFRKARWLVRSSRWWPVGGGAGMEGPLPVMHALPLAMSNGPSPWEALTRGPHAAGAATGRRCAR
jgi:hypothetical protein